MVIYLFYLFCNRLILVTVQTTWGINNMHEYSNFGNNDDTEMKLVPSDGGEDDRHTSVGLVGIQHS